MQHTPETFWAKVRKANPDECWEWQGYTSSPPGRQGRIRYGRIDAFGHAGIYAHRVAYWLAHPNEIKLKGDPGGLSVLHHCDNHICCNPAHLYLGTHQQNMLDMRVRGRQRSRRVSDGGSQKLTPDDVRWIRFLWQAKRANKRALALLYEVSIVTIKKVVYLGRYYADVERCC